MLSTVRRYGTVVVVAHAYYLQSHLSKSFWKSWFNDVDVMHVDGMFSTTNPLEIQGFVEQNLALVTVELLYLQLIIHYRIEESGIDVDTIYFDEAHNSVQKNFFPATDYLSQYAGRCYFFTATPKHSRTVYKAGMNTLELW